MLKRSLTLSTLFSLLIVLATTPASLTASTHSTPPPSQNQTETEVGRTTREAAKGTTYDQTGRVTSTTVTASDSKKVSVSFKYGELNRIQYAVLENGTRIRFVYDQAGQWQGFAFPDGGAMMFERDQAGNVVGLKRTAKPAGRKTSQHKKVIAHKAVYGSPAAMADACRDAVAAAAAAAATAAATCATLGPSVQCAAAAAAAVISATHAYNVCTESVAVEESAV